MSDHPISNDDAEWLLRYFGMLSAAQNADDIALYAAKAAIAGLDRRRTTPTMRIQAEQITQLREALIWARPYVARYRDIEKIDIALRETMTEPVLKHG